MSPTSNWKKYLAMAGGFVAALGLMLAVSQVAYPPKAAQGTGEGSPAECDSPTATVSGSDDLATYNAGTGNIVTGVCIKSGVNVGHTGLLTSNGTVDSCYTISGIGTQTVTVTRIGSGPTCQGISHIDVFTAAAPTTTPTATSIPPTSTPTEMAATSTPTESAPTATTTPTTPAGQVAPTNTPVSGGFTAPTATSAAGVQGGASEVQGATQQGATPQTGVAGSNVQRLPSTGSAATRGDDTRLIAGVLLTVIGSLVFAGSRLMRRETSS